MSLAYLDWAPAGGEAGNFEISKNLKNTEPPSAERDTPRVGLTTREGRHFPTIRLLIVAVEKVKFPGACAAPVSRLILPESWKLKKAVQFRFMENLPAGSVTGTARFSGPRVFFCFRGGPGSNYTSEPFFFFISPVIIVRFAEVKVKAARSGRESSSLFPLAEVPGVRPALPRRFAMVERCRILAGLAVLKFKQSHSPVSPGSPLRELIKFN